MTRTALCAALLCAGTLLLSQPIQAAQAPRAMPVFRAPAFPRPAIRAFRPRVLPRPAVPRAFRPLPRPKLHVHHKKPHRFARHRIPRFGLWSAFGVTVIGVAPPVYDDAEPTSQAPSGPAIARTGTAVGCQTEDVTVPGDGGKTITIIRC
jgi:hypothetical protein